MVRSIFAASAVALSILAGVEARQSDTNSRSSKTSTHTSTFTTTHTSAVKHGSTTSLTSTFSIPTAATAASTAAELTIDNGKEYIQYSTVEGYFLQDLNATVASTFDYTATNFGLINQTYSTDSSADANLTQWQRFNRLIDDLNRRAPRNTVYKLLFIGRHGEGYHNAAQTFYGTPAWNCYWSELSGNGTTTWSDAPLDNAGTTQAQAANTFWVSQLSSQKLQPPQNYYVSPLTRCLQTANLTYATLPLPAQHPFAPTVKEFFRETISTHTCDRRGNTSAIAERFPGYRLDGSLSETDEIWNGITAETPSAQDYRSKIVLDEVFVAEENKAVSVVSVTTHSGEAASLLRVLGHRVFGLVTGAIIPVLVRAETVRGGRHGGGLNGTSVTTTVPWTTSAWCTNGPPVTSLTTGADACVCSGGVAPGVGTVAASVTGA